jgi:O-antigen ligase
MTVGVVYEGALAVWQHFGLGLIQARGTFDHQNTLGMLMNLVVMVPIARVLAGPTNLLTKLAPFAAVLAGLFTGSRGTLLFLGLGSMLVFLGSAFREFTRRKAWIGLCGLLLGAILVPVALGTIESRTAQDRAGSMETRAQFESAASMMLQEHPLGVGANHYAVELFLGGYGARAGMWWGNMRAIVHNVYWLTAAEMGHSGVVALLILFVVPLVMAFRLALERRRGHQRDVLLGLGVGLAMFCAHSLFEWIWRLTEVSYVYFMTTAMVPVLAKQLRPGRSRSLAQERVTTPSSRRPAKGPEPSLGWHPARRSADSG